MPACYHQDELKPREARTMPLIVWKDEWSVGVQTLDNDHKVLIGMINELYDAMMQNHGDELIESLFRRLEEYVMAHFVREEALMREHGYSQLEAHIREHQQLAKDLDKFKQRYLGNRKSVHPMEMMEFLRRWLTGHIMRSDMGYKPLFQAQGLS